MEYYQIFLTQEHCTDFFKLEPVLLEALEYWDAPKPILGPVFYEQATLELWDSFLPLTAQLTYPWLKL